MDPCYFLDLYSDDSEIECDFDHDGSWIATCEHENDYIIYKNHKYSKITFDNSTKVIEFYKNNTYNECVLQKSLKVSLVEIN